MIQSIQRELGEVGFKEMSNVEDFVVRLAPIWDIAPSLVQTTATSLTISLRSSVDGETACTAESGTDYTTFENQPTAEQVFLLLNAVNDSVPGQRIVTDLFQAT
jgi:hypothetical protein